MIPYICKRKITSSNSNPLVLPFSKKGQSTTFGFIYGIIFIGVLALLYIIFNQVLVNYIQPAGSMLLNQSPYLNASEIIDLNDDSDGFFSFWSILPIILLVIILMWMVMVSIRSREDIPE